MPAHFSKENHHIGGGDWDSPRDKDDFVQLSAVDLVVHIEHTITALTRICRCKQLPTELIVSLFNWIIMFPGYLRF